MHNVFLGIGGNIGNKNENFRNVYKLINSEIGKVVCSSSIYESPPWGFQAKEYFWNQVLQTETNLNAPEVLDKIRSIENFFGRERNSNTYTSRKMDIDILYYDDIFLETDELIIPHPRIHQRMFVLVPLTEIAPDFKHPLLRLTSMRMLENCKDGSVLKKIN